MANFTTYETAIEWLDTNIILLNKNQYSYKVLTGYDV